LQNTADIICAIATPNGTGAIAVIRASGKGSIELVDQLFSGNLTEAQSHTLHFGTLKNERKELIDEVLISVFHEGKSFTGEESVEISCHASPFIQKEILSMVLRSGARVANSGEFTMRAFMNGKLDLSQAEAVADLIASESKASHNIALKQLRGGFSNKLKELREKLIHFASMVELELDFAEEDVEFADRTELKNLVDEVINYITTLANSFELGNAIKKGVPVAIVGAPNTGKSTLLNNLLGEDRAIVSNIAGTTRDVIEETINIEGVLFRLIDTAGIRDNAEEIEALGIQRSKEKIVQSSVVLCMSDLSVENDLARVKSWAEEIRNEFPDKKVLIVGNKIDLSKDEASEDVLVISAKEGSNIDTLKKRIVELVVGDRDLDQDIIVNNSRHYEALLRTRDALIKAQNGLVSGVTGDFVAMDIRQAMFHLGSITGDISTDDLLGNIFSKFCIGK
jgi:tRNA modification GTPase